ncbi:MAG: signal peptidase I [Clostridia bacterium]|nr:signal peptidase I [Clostridia bacterium]
MSKRKERFGGVDSVSGLPDVDELKAELKRTKKRERFRTVLRSTIYSLIVVAAAAVLIATLWMPVLRTYGSSMTPTIEDGNIVVAWKSTKFKTGDLLAFYADNKLLVKRVIAAPGQWVRIDDDGTVYVNDEELDEPYIDEKALGNCNIVFPYQVPESQWFVMGDHRKTSSDSRNTAVGCVSLDRVVGVVLFRVWPFESFGLIK